LRNRSSVFELQLKHASTYRQHRKLLAHLTCLRRVNRLAASHAKLKLLKARLAQRDAEAERLGAQVKAQRLGGREEGW
jgi:hypothetical protein